MNTGDALLTTIQTIGIAQEMCSHDFFSFGLEQSVLDNQVIKTL